LSDDAKVTLFFRYVYLGVFEKAKSFGVFLSYISG